MLSTVGVMNISIFTQSPQKKSKMKRNQNLLSMKREEKKIVIRNISRPCHWQTKATMKKLSCQNNTYCMLKRPPPCNSMIRESTFSCISQIQETQSDQTLRFSLHAHQKDIFPRVFHLLYVNNS